MFFGGDLVGGVLSEKFHQYLVPHEVLLYFLMTDPVANKTESLQIG
jgi:hypothetical protein